MDEMFWSAEKSLNDLNFVMFITHSLNQSLSYFFLEFIFKNNLVGLSLCEKRGKGIFSKKP